MLLFYFFSLAIKNLNQKSKIQIKCLKNLLNENYFDEYEIILKNKK